MFYRTQLEDTIANLMNLKQVDETTIDFIERFKKLSNKCTIQLPRSEYVAIVMGNMHPPTKRNVVCK